MSGSNAAWVVPAAASTRPQFGSSPYSAHLSRSERAMLRPTSTASSSVAAFDDLDGDLLGGALGVGDQLLAARSASTCVHRPRAASSDGVDPAGAARQQQHGVVGGHAAVGVDPVERHAGGRAQRRVERRGVGDRVGGEHAEHRGEARREHAGALDHRRRR